VIRNKAKIRATVENAREVLVVLHSYGSIHAYLASFPDADAASADVRRALSVPRRHRGVAAPHRRRP
jgi:3-methyladenine DNA glycosylase Tag